MYVIVPAINGVPDVGNIKILSAYSEDGKVAYANIETNEPDPAWTEITDPEIIERLAPSITIDKPETGPLLMDITLKQAEFEMKLDAIGTMLVPTLPEV